MLAMRSCSGFPDLKSGSIVVCHYAMGLSFMALILLTCRLHEVDREVGYLQMVLAPLLPGSAPPPTQPSRTGKALGQPAASGSGSTDSKLTDRGALIMRHLSRLRSEVESFLSELISSRMTLILSVVFVGIYIFSWWWMAFAINQGNVSLRTVLLLAVFAAVDIAASAGFVLLRIIMYIRRDQYYPHTLQSFSLEGDHEQLAAYTALRLITIKSSCGNADILVIVVVGFLTVLRIYSVLCVVSFYKKAKNGSRDIFQKDIAGSSDASERGESVKDMDEYTPKSLIVDYNSSRKHGMSSHRSRRSSLAATSTVDEEFHDLKIQASDMSMDMQRAALTSAAQAIKLYSTEKHIAESIKQDFDQLYHPTWHCIVGRNWGSCVTHSRQSYVRIVYKDLTIMLYRST